MSSLQLPYSIQLTNPLPVDKYYGPYPDISTVLLEVPLSIRYKGLTVFIIDDSEYWWINDLSDNGLVPKVLGISGITGIDAGGDLIGHFPNPYLKPIGVSGTWGSSTQVPEFITDGVGRVISVTGINIYYPITTFEGRTGDIQLTISDISNTLGYVPYSSTNPSFYISKDDNITSGDLTGIYEYPTIKWDNSYSILDTRYIQLTTPVITNNGNAFGSTMTIGTTDNNILRFIQNNTNYLTLSGGGVFGSFNGSWDINQDGSISLSNSNFQINSTGDIVTGSYKGTVIADNYIASANTWNGKQNNLGGTGIVRSVGGSISYINDVSTKFVKADGSLDSTRYASLTGATYTGPVYLYADPTSDFEAATKRYVDNNIVGVVDLQGGYDPTITSQWPLLDEFGNSIKKGQLWYISVSGFINGIEVLAGYSIFALIDNPGQTNTNWEIINTGLGYVPVPNTRQINTISGITGGGDLTIDRTFTIDKTKVPYYPSGFSLGFSKWSGSSWIFDNSNYITSVTGSLGYTPINFNGNGILILSGTNPSYITGTSNQFIKANGTLDSNTYLTSITSSQITGALGYTPYSNTNPSGYITSVSITSSQITGALGYVPYSNTNPNGYITSVTGSLGYTPINFNGNGIIIISGTNPTYLTGPSTSFVKANGTLDSNTYLTAITSSQITGALGYVPYSSTNPSGYISGITSSQVTTALGYTPYSNTNPSNYITSVTGSLGYTPINFNGNGIVILSGTNPTYLTGPSTSFVKANGTLDSNTYLTSISITSSQVTGALGYIPYSNTNPSGYITSVTGTLGYTPINFNGNGIVILSGTNPTYLTGPSSSFVKANGTLDSNTYLTSISITSSQVTTALGYTPYSTTNPSNYITSVTGSLGYTPINFNGNGIIILSGTNPTYLSGPSTSFVKANGTLDSNTYLTNITSGQVTGALGYVPYSNTNPNGYITSISITSSQVTSALGYVPYSNTNPNGYITSVTGALGYTPISTVFGRNGAVTGVTGDYNTLQVIENTNLYFTNSRAINATLNGYLSGAGLISSSDSIISAIQKLNGNISLVTGAIVYQGTWNASTNTPTFVSGVGTKGYMYKVSVAGSTLIDGISQWNIGDQIVFNGTIWDKIDGTATEVLSVNGLVGIVPLTGTSNRITVSGSNVFDIASNYIGQTSISTIGTIVSGTWNGTSLTDSYISSSSIWNAKQNQLNGNGIVIFSGTNPTYLTGPSTSFVKANGSLDSNTYLTNITSSQVTGALGYTPYSITNPNGFISSVTGSLGYTPINFNGIGVISLSGTNPSYITGTSNQFIKANGTLDSNTYLTSISITSSQVTGALGYVPYSSTNPSGFISSVTGTLGYIPINFNGTGLVILSGTNPTYLTGPSTSFVKANGTLDSNTYLTNITSSQITGTLGYTPYSNTNPSNYITSVIGSLGYTPYSSTNPNGFISSVTGTLGYTPINFNGNGIISLSGTNPTYITGPSTSFIKANGSLDSSIYLTSVNSSQIISAIGFNPINFNGTGIIILSGTNPTYLTGPSTSFVKANGTLDSNTYITGITSVDVINALGYTPSAGGGGRNVQSGTAYTILNSDFSFNHSILASTNNSAIRTFTVPLASTVSSGKVLWISDEAGTSSTYPIYLTMSGGDTLNGSSGTFIFIRSNYSVIGIYSNGSNGYYAI